MSGQSRLWDDGPNPPGNGVGAAEYRASLARELRYLLTISTESRGVGQLSPSGLAHSMGVCMTEVWLMARGKKGEGAQGGGAAMPRFIDVRLDQTQRTAFLQYELSDREVIERMQRLTLDGYRFGCAWSTEQQAYTVSLTCRDEASPNNGLCMTSFARFLRPALCLALYKHYEVTHGVWVVPGAGDAGDFG